MWQHRTAAGFTNVCQTWRLLTSGALVMCLIGSDRSAYYLLYLLSLGPPLFHPSPFPLPLLSSPHPSCRTTVQVKFEEQPVCIVSILLTLPHKVYDRSKSRTESSRCLHLAVCLTKFLYYMYLHRTNCRQ